MSKFSIEDNDALLNLLYCEEHPSVNGPSRKSISRAIDAIRRCAELEEENESLRSLVRELEAEIDNATAKIYESVEHEAGQRVMLSGEALTILISALSRIPEELR